MRAPRLDLRIGTVLLLGAGGFAACQSPSSGSTSTVPGKCADLAPTTGAQKTDILFVIDNSESMFDKQAAVARELPAFVQVLQQGAGLQQDFQIGAITTSVYAQVLYDGGIFYRTYPTQSGKLQPVPDGLADGGVVLGTGTERILSGADPLLVDKFGRLVRVGIYGSGHETPFEATRLATSWWDSVPLTAGGNQGFLRDGAQLLIVTVMDEDDCSEWSDPSDAGWRPQVYVGVDKNRAPGFIDYCTQQSANLTSVDRYYAAFQGLKDSTGALRTIIWADIGPVSLADKAAVAYEDRDAGTLRNVDCPNSEGAGYRHRALALDFDSSLSDLDSICDPSYHDALVAIAGKAVARQSIQVANVPDPGLLRVTITRGTGVQSACTVANGGITFEVTPSGTEFVHFHGPCERQITDTGLSLSLLCAG